MPSLFATTPRFPQTALAAKSRSTARVGPVVEVLGQTIGGSDIRELMALPNASASSLKIRAAGFEISLDAAG